LKCKNVKKGNKARLGKRLTHCKRGHELSGDNVYIVPNNGARACALCKSIIAAEKYKLKKEKYAAS
jgi:hypothetical protein